MDSARQELGSVRSKTMNFLHLPWAQKDGEELEGRGGVGEREAAESLLGGGNSFSKG